MASLQEPPEVSRIPLRFVPRLDFATADFERKDVIDWGDSVQVGDHLLIALVLSHFRVALVLIDTDWRIAAVLRIPIELNKIHSKDDVGALKSAKLIMLSDSTESFTGLLCVKQAWHRFYPLEPGKSNGPGTILRSDNLSWFRFKCQFFAGVPILQSTLERTDTERDYATFVRVGDKGYWFSTTLSLPPPGPAFSGMRPVYGPLEIAEADESGLPRQWRRVEKLDWAYEEHVPTDGKNRVVVGPVGPYNETHALCLVSVAGWPNLVPVRLADGAALPSRKFSLRTRWRQRLAWSHSHSGGTLWYYVSNEKRSAAKRDRSLRRVDYGPDLAMAKRASDAIRVNRLSEDRVMTRTAILDYGDIVIAMWENGLNITNPNELRCITLRRTAGGASHVHEWTCEDADDLINDLPLMNGYEVRWMGKHLPTLPTRAFPRNAFKLGKSLGAAFLYHCYEPYRMELLIGEFVHEPAVQI